MPNKFDQEICQKVDTIASLDAQIAELKAERENLMSQLKAEGEGCYGGSEHFVRVSLRQTISYPGIKEKVSRQWLTAHRKVTESLRAEVKGWGKDGSPNKIFI